MSDEEGGRTRRWEQPLGEPGEGIPKDPAERVDWLLAVTSQTPDHASAALLQVLVHAGTALRCRRAALEGVVDQTSEDASLRALGEASMGVVALYLAASAARIACDELDNPGPLGRRRHDELLSMTEHLRDCVMHWDDKGRSGTPAGLNVTDHDVLVHGPARPGARGPDTVASITWRQFESCADRLRRWAEYLLEERILGSHPSPDAGPNDPAGMAPASRSGSADRG